MPVAWFDALRILGVYPQLFPNVHALLLALSVQKNSIAWEARLLNETANYLDVDDHVDVDELLNELDEGARDVCCLQFTLF